MRMYSRNVLGMLLCCVQHVKRHDMGNLRAEGAAVKGIDEIDTSNDYLV